METSTSQQQQGCGGGRVTLAKQSSLAPERDGPETVVLEEGIDPRVRLMYMANEGDMEGIKELLDSGTNVNFRDIDGRTALHVAACQGLRDVVQLLLQSGAEIDPQDCWGSTPLADAIYYKNHEVIKLLEDHGAKHPMAPMHVENAREVPEYEIDPRELDFSNSVEITKMIEGVPPFRPKPEKEVPKAYVANERPPFRASAKHYAYGLKELIEECWSQQPFNRPTFRQIIKRLECINNQLARSRHWKVQAVLPLKCFKSLEAMFRRNRSNQSNHSTSYSTTR